MVDIELIANQLRSYGHLVTHIVNAPNNGGTYEFTVNGAILTLEEARALLATDEETGKPRRAAPQ